MYAKNDPHRIFKQVMKEAKLLAVKWNMINKLMKKMKYCGNKQISRNNKKQNY